MADVIDVLFMALAGFFGLVLIIGGTDQNEGGAIVGGLVLFAMAIIRFALYFGMHITFGSV